MSYISKRKILLTLLSVVFAICCFFAIQLSYVYADESGELSGALSEDVTFSDISYTADDVIYLNGYTVTISSSVTVSDDATLTIYAGADNTGNYLSLTGGSISGSFTISEDNEVIYVSGSSVTVNGNADLYGTIDVTAFTLEGGELYVNNSSSSVNDGYALKAASLSVEGGVAIMQGSNSFYDVYLINSLGSAGTFNYKAGSFYTATGVNATPAGFVNYVLTLKTPSPTSTYDTTKEFSAVSKVYVDGTDYNIAISNTTKVNQSNCISLYVSSNSHSISVIDGDGEWATYTITPTANSGFLLSSQEAPSSLDLSSGTIKIYSQKYTQGTTEKLWGGEYTITASSKTSNQIIVTSDNDLTLNFSGGGTFTNDCVISFAPETDGKTPEFTICFDGETYNFGTGTAISITGGSLEICSSDSTSSDINVTFGGIVITNASVAMSYGTVSAADKSVQVTSGTFVMDGGTISGGGYAVYADSSTVTIGGGSIYNNKADNGAIYAYKSTLTVTGGEIYGNTGVYAGAIYADQSTLALNGGIISGNYCTADAGGGAVMCHNSVCTVGGSFIYSNYKNIDNTVTSCYGLYGDDSSTVTIISGIISDYYGAKLSQSTVEYSVDLESEITLTNVTFGSVTYAFSGVDLSLSSLSVYSSQDNTLLSVSGTDANTTAVSTTYALFNSNGSGLSAKQLEGNTISAGGEYYLTGDYTSVEVSKDATIYIQNANIGSLSVSSGVTLTIYVVDTNTITTLSGGSVIIEGSGSVEFGGNVTSSLTVTSGIIDFNGYSATVVVSGGAFIDSGSITATNSDSETLTALAISFSDTITSVVVDKNDYGIAGSITSFSLYLTKEDHTVTISTADCTYIYEYTWSDTSSTFILSGTTYGDFLYNLSGGSITITDSGYTVGTDTTDFTGSYVIYSSSDDKNDITVSGSTSGTQITLNGVIGGTLTISGGTVYITLADGTENSFDKIIVANGATLYLYCSLQSAHSCTDNCGVICVTELEVSGTLYIYGGVVTASEVTVNNILYILGGELNGAAITADGTLYINGGAIYEATISVSGTLNVNGGTIYYSQITASGTLNITKGSVLYSTITVSGTAIMSGGIVSADSSSDYSAFYVNGGTLTVRGGTVYGNSAMDTSGAVYIYANSRLYVDGGIISGGVYVEADATITVTDGVIMNGGGYGDVTLSGGYVYGDFYSVRNNDGDEIFLIEISLPDTLDISTITITVGEDTYSIGQSYTTNVLYIYGGSESTTSLECTVLYSQINYVYSLELQSADFVYRLPDKTRIDVSVASYLLSESRYRLYGEETDTIYVSNGYYVISKTSDETCYPLYTSGSVTLEFNSVTGMSAINVEESGAVLYGKADFADGISVGSELVIGGGTFTAAYIGSNVVVQGGSLTADNVTADGQVTVEDGTFTAETFYGKLTVTGGEVVITEAVPNTATITIDGGSVNAAFEGTPANSSGNRVYLFTPDLSLIEGEIYSVLVDSESYNISGEYTDLYLYITGQSHVVSIESSDAYLVYNLVYSSGSFTDYENGVIDISAGSVVITSSGYSVDGGELTEYVGDYVFLQSDEDSIANTITVDGASVTIYLYGLFVYTDEDYVINVINGAEVTIVLPDDADNIIIADVAGIYVDGASSLDMACAHTEESGHTDCSDCGILYSYYLSRIFYVEGTLNVNGGYYIGGSAEQGGVIYVANGGTVNINGGILAGNEATYGGAVYISDGYVNIYGGYIYSNEAAYGGVVYVESGRLYISGGNILSNSATYGGAVYAEGGTLTLAEGLIYANSATAGGGIVVGAGAAANIYGGYISLNTATYGSAIYVYGGGTLKVYGGIITEENIVTCQSNASVYVCGGILSVYADSLQVTGGSVNVLNGSVTDGTNVLYCLQISLEDLLSLKVDGEQVEWDFSEVYSSATVPEYLYIWLNSSAHLIEQTTSLDTTYYIAVFNGATFTLHAASGLSATSVIYDIYGTYYEIDTYGYYYIDVTSDNLRLAISAECVLFLSGKGLSSLTINGSCIANVYGLDGYEISTIAVDGGVLILNGITADTATVAESSSLKISDSSIGEVTLGASAKLILNNGEINITTVNVSAGSYISVSGSPVLTGIITVDFASSASAILFADSTVIDYVKYFVSGDVTYATIMEEGDGLRLVMAVVTLTISSPNGSVYIGGTEYSDGDKVSLAFNAAYTISFSPDLYYYLSSAKIGSTTVESTITLIENSKLIVVYTKGNVAAYSEDGSTYIGAYSSISNAVNASYTYVQMLTDSTVSITISSNITLDLNGYTVSNISVASGYTVTVTGDGSLVVTNSGTVIINSGSATVTNNNGGTLMVYGGEVTVANVGTLTVYSGLITVNSNDGTIISYGGVFTTGGLTVYDGSTNVLTAVEISLPAGTTAVYVDGTNYNISLTEDQTVYMYVLSGINIYVNISAGYRYYTISGDTAVWQDEYTVYNISEGFVTITTAGNYYIFQTDSNVYGITVELTSSTDEVTLHLDCISLQSAGYALRIVCGTVYLHAQGSELYGTLGDIVVEEDGCINIADSVTADVTINGGEVGIAGSITGDVTSYGGTLYSDGSVTGDFNVYGGQAEINGIVNGNTEVNGGTLYLNGQLYGNLTVYSGYFLSYSSTIINGDLTVYGGEVYLYSAHPGEAITVTVYGDIVIEGGTLTVDDDCTLTVASDIEVSGGEMLSQGSVVGSIIVGGGDLTISGGIYADGILTVEDGTVTIDNSIFYDTSTLIITNGTTYINGGLFLGTVTIHAEAYCVVSGGAFANDISDRTLDSVDISSSYFNLTTSVTSVAFIGGTTYSVSLTLPSTTLYLASGYYLNINGVTVAKSISAMSSEPSGFGNTISSSSGSSVTIAATDNSSYTIGDFTGSLTISAVGGKLYLWLVGCNMDSITVSVSNLMFTTCNIYIYVESGTNIVGSITKSKTSSYVKIHLYANGGLLYCDGALTADEIEMNGGMIVAGSFTSATPATDATLAVVDLSSSTSVAEVWIAAPDEIYSFTLDYCYNMSTLYLWYGGKTDESYEYIATVLSFSGTFTTIDLCYSEEAGVIANSVEEDIFDHVITGTLEGYTVQYLVNGSWTATVPTDAGTYSARLMYTVGEYSEYTVYKAYDSWTVTISSSAISAAVTWSNTNVSEQAINILTATTAYNIELTLTYYDAAGNLLSSEPTSAGVYTVVATCADDSYTLTNNTITYVIGNYTLASKYSGYTVTITGTNTYTTTGNNVYLEGAVNYIYIEGVDVYYMAVYNDSSYNYVLTEGLGSFDMSYGDLVIDANGFTYCGVTFTGYSGDYTLTGGSSSATVTVNSGCTANITLDSCTLLSIGGDGTIVVTISYGLCSVESITAAMVIIEDGAVLSQSLNSSFITNGTTQVYDCLVELDGEYAVIKIEIDGVETEVLFTASSFILYLTAEDHSIILTLSDDTQIEYTATYSNGFTCTVKEDTSGGTTPSEPTQPTTVVNSWTSESYVFTVRGEVIEADSEGVVYITVGTTFTVSGYQAAYGEVQYLYCSTINGTYTDEVPTAAGTYYVLAYVAAGSNYDELEGTPQKFVLEEMAATYTVTVVSLGEVIYTGSYTANSVISNSNVNAFGVTVTAPDGFTFDRWVYADGTYDSSFITVDSNITVYARFKATLSLEVEGDGTVSINGISYTTNGSVTIYYGTEYEITTQSSYVAHICLDGTILDGTSYTLTPYGDCTLKVVFDDNGVVVYVGSVSETNKLGMYNTLAEAFDAADGYSVIYVVLNTDVSAAIEVYGNVTINLNGYVWEAEGTVVTGSLTIIDTDANAASGIALVAETQSAVGTVNGTVTVEGGTVYMQGGTVQQLYLSEGTAYIEDGTLTSAYVGSKATLSVSGGNILSVTGYGNIVNGTSMLYSLQIPVDSDVTSVLVNGSDTYSVTTIDGIVYLWLSSDAATVEIDGTTHTLTYKNGTFTLENAWTSTRAMYSILAEIPAEIDYGDEAVTDSLLAEVQSIYGTACVQYSTDTDTWSDDYPSSAGDYYVRIYVAAGANYTALSSDWVEVTINKSSSAKASLFNVTIPDVSSLVYDGSAKTVKITATVDVGGITLYYSTDGVTWTTAKPANAGTYYFAIDIAGNDSMTAATKFTDGSWTFTITRQTVTNPEEDTQTYVYSGDSCVYTLTGSTLYSISNNAKIEAGTYTVTVTLNDKTNYAWADDTDGDGIITYTFVILPQTVQTPTADSTSYVYSGSVLTYIIADNDNYTVSGGSQRNADTYYVTVSLLNKNNYCWSDGSTEDLVFEFVIEKAQANLVVENLTVEYGEDIDFAWTADSDTGEVTVVYYLNGSQTEILSAGVYSAIVTIAETDNYNSATVNVTVTVNKASQETVEAVAVMYSSAEEIRKGESYAISLSGLQVTDGTITYTSSDESVATVSEDGTVTIVGIGTYTITVTLTGDSCYADWVYELDEVTIRYDFTWVYMALMALAALAVISVIVIIPVKRHRAKNRQEVENILAVSRAFEWNEAQEREALEAELAAEEAAQENSSYSDVRVEKVSAVAETEEGEPAEKAVPLTPDEADVLIKRYRENENILRKIDWGAEET
ncbi:MAG: Ig-like domain-containing protein [Clostridia bacterium]|nr:Ig-like domain-containing protein [Clostridia bacterium]